MTKDALLQSIHKIKNGQTLSNSEVNLVIVELFTRINGLQSELEYLQSEFHRAREASRPKDRTVLPSRLDQRGEPTGKL